MPTEGNPPDMSTTEPFPTPDPDEQPSTQVEEGEDVEPLPDPAAEEPGGEPDDTF